MKKINFVIGLFGALTMVGCNKDLQFDDPRTLTTEEAFEVPGAGVKLGVSAIDRTLNQVFSGRWGVHMLCMADQITTTNRYSEFWDFAQEPRLTIRNSDTYGGYGAISQYYANFYQANLDANQIINNINNGGKITDANGNDRTADSKTAAFFAKGIAQGYLGGLYDRGLVVNGPAPETLPTDFDNSYKEMVQSGVAYLDSAIAAANANSNFKFDFIVGFTLTKAQFIAWANSMAARIMASAPRDLAEAKALGTAYWDKVDSYASKGLSTNLIYTYVTDGIYQGTLDWALALLGDGAGYLPIDIKLAWLQDPSHPKYYPSGTTVLPPVTPKDPRFTDYIGYDPDFGFLRNDRNRGLFTNYYRKRWDNPDNTVAVPGAIVPFYLAEENRYLQAEAKLMKGDAAGAAALLNAPTARRKAIGNLPDVAATEAAVRHELHYEYSLEIDAAGGVLPVFAFMRRNDLLIGGTPTELPIPAQQLNVIKADLYSFGGKANAGATGKFGEITTAKNVGWKPSE